MTSRRVPYTTERTRQEDRDKRRRVVMKRDTRKPPAEPRRAPGGPTPAGRTRRSRRAEQGRKQGPARLCAPQSARPDQQAAARPPSETAQAATRVAPGAPDTEKSDATRAAPKPKPAISETLSHKGALALAKQLEK